MGMCNHPQTNNPAYKLRKAFPHLETEEQTMGITPTAAAPRLDNSVHGLPLVHIILESWRRRWVNIFSKAPNVTAPWD